MLRWAAGDTLTFRAEMDGWAHLYALPVAGGAAKLLTPGDFIVENVRPTPDGAALLYTANTGRDAGRRRPPPRLPRRRRRRPPVALTPAAPASNSCPRRSAGALAYVGVDARTRAGGGRRRDARGGVSRRSTTPPTPIPPAALVVPQRVTFTAADGTIVHGQLFATGGAARSKPGGDLRPRRAAAADAARLVATWIITPTPMP